MKKCEYYHTRKRYVYDPYITTIKHTIVEGECRGTPERDTCHCRGDKCKCDVDPGIKQRALKEKQNKKGKMDVVRTLKYYLDSNEENGVVYIPKFLVEKMIEELADK